MLSEILENINEGVITAGKSGRISYINAYARRLLSPDCKEFIGRNISDFVKIKDATSGAETHFPIQAVLKTKTPLKNLNHTILVGSGNQQAHIEYDINPLPSSKDSVNEVMISIRDITGQRKLEEDSEQRLRKINEELEQFIYIASHDLQEPLRMVASYVQLLEKRYKGRLDDDADEFISYTVGGVKKMKDILSDLLSFSRLNTRKEELVEADCNELVGGIKLNFLAKPDNKINFKIGELPVMKCYAGQIIQLFYHLIDNAVKFSDPENCTVTIDCNKDASGWLFSVQDQGIGIDSKYSEKVFSMFQRLHSSKEYPGTGVGLALCRKIVENHGGSIWFVSKTGSGSTFYFSIPQEESIPEN
jgi:PAS domain S-box-containing protein